LDETYERTLQEIGKEKWEYAYRLFQCITVARRPLRVAELAEFLAFDFEAEGSPIFRADWRSEDAKDTVLSTCSTLVSIVDAGGSPVVQFSHFSVKEYLTSSRMLEGRVPRYHIPLEPAHVVVTEACLSILLQLDNDITRERIKEFPLAKYAAHYWVYHAKFGDMLSHTEDMMKRLFKPGNPHFSAWMWTYNLEGNFSGQSKSMVTETPTIPPASPLYYAALFGFHGIAEWLLTTFSEDVNAQGGGFGPLIAASHGGHLKVVEVLLKHNAAVNQPDYMGWVALQDASCSGHLEICRVLLEFGADVNPSDEVTRTEPPLWKAVENGHVEIAKLLIERGADINIRNLIFQPLYLALQSDRPELAQLLLEHGADVNFPGKNGKTLMHLASEMGYLGVARRLLELGAGAHARNSEGQTPFQVASRKGNHEVAQLLLEHGAERT
jgi:ankyrin repeat protein